MDEFDFKEERPKSRYRFGSALWNIASLITLLGTLCAGAYFALIFFYPQSGFNPFPPVITATAQPPTATLEASPTETATENPTATPELPTPTLEQAGASFQIQEGSPAALDASVFHPELACNFLGVAGQAFGLDDAPIAGLRVQVTGTLNNQAVDKLGLTGAATQYGSGAYYEIQLADQPIASDNALQIVLLNAEGQAISDPFTFSTTDSCQQNLILINFKEQP